MPEHTTLKPSDLHNNVLNYAEHSSAPWARENSLQLIKRVHLFQGSSWSLNRCPTSTLFSLRSRISSFCCFSCCCSSWRDPILSVAAASCMKRTDLYLITVQSCSIWSNSEVSSSVSAAAVLFISPFALPRSCLTLLQLYPLSATITVRTNICSSTSASYPHQLILNINWAKKCTIV